MDEHTISIRSVQVFEGSFDASCLKDDGTLIDGALALDPAEEVSKSFECSCGDRFHKQKTAVNHLVDKAQ